MKQQDKLFEQLKVQIESILGKKPVRIVVSRPRQSEIPLRAELVCLSNGKWQLETIRNHQAFHQNFIPEQLVGFLCNLLSDQYTQLHAFSEKQESRIRVTKKGKLLVSKSATQQTQGLREHNRDKRRLLPQGILVPPLVDMGILTPNGDIVKSMHSKYRQINRFVELVDDALEQDTTQLRILDFGCGKSYLTFVLYYYLTQIRDIKLEMTGLDLKADVVEKCNQAAEKYGYDGLSFKVGDISGYQQAESTDVVITLHACDTATDLALGHAVSWNVPMIFSVSCCQHELNSQFQTTQFSMLSRYGVVQERISALMTDAIRANLLTACGYRAQVVEFVDLADTPKNLLLRAKQADLPMSKRKKALQEVQAVCQEFGFSPTLLTLLKEQKIPPFV